MSTHGARASFDGIETFPPLPGHLSMLRSLIVCFCALCCLAAAPATQPSLQQKCESLRSEWNNRFRPEKLATVVSPPFVVAGDGGPARVQRYLDHTINAAADSLHRKFFDKAKPTEPILILLFESDGPYRRLAKKWFNDTDISRFGYFRHDNI